MLQSTSKSSTGWPSARGDELHLLDRRDRPLGRVGDLGYGGLASIGGTQLAEQQHRRRCARHCGRSSRMVKPRSAYAAAASARAAGGRGPGAAGRRGGRTSGRPPPPAVTPRPAHRRRLCGRARLSISANDRAAEDRRHGARTARTADRGDLVRSECGSRRRRRSPRPDQTAAHDLFVRAYLSTVTTCATAVDDLDFSPGDGAKNIRRVRDLTRLPADAGVVRWRRLVLTLPVGPRDRARAQRRRKAARSSRCTSRRRCPREARPQGTLHAGTRGSHEGTRRR